MKDMLNGIKQNQYDLLKANFMSVCYKILYSLNQRYFSARVIEENK